MSNYFDIIISLKELIQYLNELMHDYKIFLYVEKWNKSKLFYLEEVDTVNFNPENVITEDYKGLFFSSKKINPKLVSSFYDQKLSNYAIEIKGGRETNRDLELIRFRLLSKKPDKTIKLFFKQFQNLFQHDDRFSKGVKWGNHFYDKIYYDKKLPDKFLWEDLSKKEYEIIISDSIEN